MSEASVSSSVAPTRLRSFVKKMQTVSALSPKPDKQAQNRRAEVTLSEKERQSILWQHSRSGDSLNTIQSLLRFFDRLGQRVTEDELLGMLPQTWTEGGAPVTAEFVLQVLTRKKQDFELFRNDPDDLLTLFVSFGGNPDRTGAADTVDVLEAMTSYGVKVQGVPLAKPKLGFGEFSQFMTSLKGSLSDDVANKTPSVLDLPVPKGRKRSMWQPAKSDPFALGSSDNPVDLSLGFISEPVEEEEEVGNVTSMEMSLRFSRKNVSEGDAESAAAPLKHFINTAVHLHEKRMKIIDTRRNETRALIEDLANRPRVKPVRFNGQLIEGPKKKFTGTKCVPPVMLLREAFKMELLLADVEEVAQVRMEQILAKTAAPKPSHSQKHGATANSRPSSAASSTRSSQLSSASAPRRVGLDDPACDLLVRDIARTAERAAAAEEHRERVAAKKQEIALARAGEHMTAPYCLSEADVAVPHEGGTSAGLRALHPASMPKAKLPDASLLRGSSM
jgi:hypothetical protein